MKLFLLLVFLPLMAQAASSIEAQIGAYSNFIWRGITFSENKPALQANIDAEGPYAFYLATFISNAEFTDDFLEEEVTQEIDLIVGKRWFIDELELQLYYSRFTFPNASVIDSDEYNFQAKYNEYYLELSFMDDYFGYKDSYKYARIGYEYFIRKDLDLTLLVGYSDFAINKGSIKQNCQDVSCTTNFSTTSGSGSTDYFDFYLVGRKSFSKVRAELGFNFTNRQEYTVENGEVLKERAEDFSAVVAVIMPFAI